MRIVDGDVTEISNLHPPDSELALAGEHRAHMHLRKTVNHQPTKHLCAKPVRGHECLSASCWTAGEQLKGSSPFTDCRNARHLYLISFGEGGLQPKPGGCEDRRPALFHQLRIEVNASKTGKISAFWNDVISVSLRLIRTFAGFAMPTWAPPAFDHKYSRAAPDIR